MVPILLSITFACGLFIAGAHVLNRRFVAPAYDVAANLAAFGCATAASLILGNWIPAGLSACAIACWLVLARRTIGSLGADADAAAAAEPRRQQRHAPHPAGPPTGPGRHHRRPHEHPDHRHVGPAHLPHPPVLRAA